MAAQEAFPDTVEKLLAHGANPNLHPFYEPGSLNQTLIQNSIASYESFSKTVQK